jgi:hypothetical protein
VVMVSMCLLGALLLDYYGKTVLWSWCISVYWALYYWIIMGRICCGHGVYVSTGGSTTGLLWEDYVVVMVSLDTMTTTQSSHNNPVVEPRVDT